MKDDSLFHKGEPLGSRGGGTSPESKGNDTDTESEMPCGGSHRPRNAQASLFTVHETKIVTKQPRGIRNSGVTFGVCGQSIFNGQCDTVYVTFLSSLICSLTAMKEDSPWCKPQGVPRGEGKCEGKRVSPLTHSFPSMAATPDTRGKYIWWPPALSDPSS